MKLFKIKTWIIAFLGLGLTFIIVRVLTPAYPPINKAYSKNQVKQFITDILKEETRNISFENLSTSTRGGAPVEYTKNFEYFINSLYKCEDNRECIIDSYNDFMSENVSVILRKKTRSYYMLKKFGIFGEKLNKTIGFMY